MIRLGHIVYSNCYPVHARLLETEAAADVTLVRGTPAELNRALEAGDIDVAPCSSIEFARHADRYHVLGGLAIASTGPVESIILESAVPLEMLDGRTVAVPTASATSVVLLRALLETQRGIRARFEWFDQKTEPDPIDTGTAAALRIGDVALRRSPPAGRFVLDLGQAWSEWTRLPFVYAIWQTRLPPDDPELRRLHETLFESLDWFEHEIDRLAQRRAAEFGLAPDRLARYWQALQYRLDPAATRGLLHFFELAAALGEAPPIRSIAFV